MNQKMSNLTIRDIYPHLDESQLKEAEENLEQYLEVVLRIHERILADPLAYNKFKALTESEEGRKMNITMEDHP